MRDCNCFKKLLYILIFGTSAILSEQNYLRYSGPSLEVIHIYSYCLKIQYQQSLELELVSTVLSVDWTKSSMFKFSSGNSAKLLSLSNKELKKRGKTVSKVTMEPRPLWYIRCGVRWISCVHYWANAGTQIQYLYEWPQSIAKTSLHSYGALWAVYKSWQ